MFEINRAVCLHVDKRWTAAPPIASRFAPMLDVDVDYFTCGNGDRCTFWEYNHIDVDTSTGLLPVWEKRLPSFNAFLCFRKIVAQAKRDGVRRLLLLEDDALPIDGAMDILREAEKEINILGKFPDMLYLGANHTWSFTRQLSQHLLQVRGALCWHAVILTNAIFDAVLALPMREAIDLVAAQELHYKYRCWAVWPNAVIQEAGFSHCDGKNVDYSAYFLHRGQPF